MFKYWIDGGRCSGDMNTAMGNIIIACGAVYSFLYSQGVHNLVRVLDAGDDCCIIGEFETIQRLTPSLSPWFLQLGLIMKVEPLVTVFEQISFCQTSPVYDGVRWRMVRDPRVSLSKDQSILHLRHIEHLTNYLSTIGDCGISLTGGLPVLQEYYRALGAGRPHTTSGVVGNVLETGMFHLSRGMRENYRPVTDEARVSFWRAFGIVPDLQIAIEDHFRTLSVPSSVSVTDDEIDRVDLGIGVAICN